MANSKKYTIPLGDWPTVHCSLLVLETMMDVTVRIVRYLCYLRIDIPWIFSIHNLSASQHGWSGGV